jgi:26S proteasome regulatory subunit N5
MEKREKTDFILEQMRLCLAKKDFIRTQIISRKISTKYFRDETVEVRVSFWPEDGRARFLTGFVLCVLLNVLL